MQNAVIREAIEISTSKVYNDMTNGLIGSRWKKILEVEEKDRAKRRSIGKLSISSQIDQEGKTLEN